VNRRNDRPYNTIRRALKGKTAAHRLARVQVDLEREARVSEKPQ